MPERNDFDYGDDGAPPPPTQEAFANLNALVSAAIAAEVELEKASEVQKAKRQALDALIMEAIPTAMDQMGLKEFTTLSGLTIKVKEDLSHSLAADRKPAGLDWLEKNGHGSIIKSELTISFAKGKEAEARQVLSELQSAHPGLPIEQGRDVHSATLKSLLKQLMEKGVDVPVDIFKVARVRKAVLK